MKVRKGGLSDIDKIVAYGEQFWEFTRYKQLDQVPYNARHVEEMLRDLMGTWNKGFALVIEDDEGEVKGFGLVVQTPLIWNRDYKVAGELAYYLDDEVRGSGAGIQLLNAMEKLARKRGMNYMAMISMNHSMDVGPLYKRMGYTETETTWTKELTDGSN